MDYKSLAFKQKMFRQKPYTKCFQCIQTQKLKCKKCMSAIIQTFLMKNKSMQSPLKYQFRSKIKMNETRKQSQNSFRNTFNNHQQSTSTLSINTNYGFWMNKVQYKREKNIDIVQSTLTSWPHKKAIKSNKLKILQEAKFENWQKRLLKRLQNSQNPLKKMNKSQPKLIR